MFAAAKQKFTAAVVAPLYNRSITAAVVPRRFFSVLAEEKRCMKDHNRRLMAKKYEVKRNLYKAMCRTPDLPADFKEKQRYKLSKLPRNSAFSRIRNRCILTGRPRAVYQLFRMSRICFRDLANKGELMGIKKASW